MKVVIAVGGGGHFAPALAVMEQMPKDWEVLLVGRKYAFEGDKALSLEYQTAKRLGLQFETITTARLQRRITKHTLASLVKMPMGLAQSKRILAKYKPDVVLSFGGYISVPVVLAAAMQHVPIVIHEQTLGAGLANKISAGFASKICLSWQESAQFFPKEKALVTGNPLRKEFFFSGTSGEGLGTRLHSKNVPLVYITGGSGGAHGINVLIEGCLEKLLEQYSVIHQTGDASQFGDFERLEKKKAELPERLQKRYDVRKFTQPEDVLQIMSTADLVISRSGINTVTELLYLGKPCLLIPLPYGQRNEQMTNAEFVKRIGLAEIVDQIVTTPEALLGKINEMISGLDKYKNHTQEARRLIHTDAGKKIIEEVISVAKK